MIFLSKRTQKADFVQVIAVTLQRRYIKMGGSTLKTIHYKLMDYDP